MAKSTQSLAPTEGQSSGLSVPSGSRFFPVELINRCLLPEDEATTFREESRMEILRDPDTESRIVFFVHPDGRILMDAIRQPANNPDQPRGLTHPKTRTHNKQPKRPARVTCAAWFSSL